MSYTRGPHIVNVTARSYVNAIAPEARPGRPYQSVDENRRFRQGQDPPDLSLLPGRVGTMKDEKWCPCCEQLLPLDRFGFRDRAHKRPQSYCRTCSNLAWREWYSKPANKARHLELLRRRRKRRFERNKAIIRHLKGQPCSDCDGIFPPEALDFDHLSDKRDLISSMAWAYSTFRLLEEIDKCEVVCANCHRIRTTMRIRRRLEQKPSTR